MLGVNLLGAVRCACRIFYCNSNMLTGSLPSTLGALRNLTCVTHTSRTRDLLTPVPTDAGRWALVAGRWLLLGAVGLLLGAVGPGTVQCALCAHRIECVYLTARLQTSLHLCPVPTNVSTIATSSVTVLLRNRSLSMHGTAVYCMELGHVRQEALCPR
jgi:hypothetical protein